MVIPPPGHKPLLEQLQQTHLGVSRMKSLARGYAWWPDLNADIEQYVWQCNECQASRPQPPTAPIHSWAIPKQPWHWLHLDYAGPFMGSMFLVVVDAFSKWVDVGMMNTITSSATIEMLQRLMAFHTPWWQTMLWVRSSRPSVVLMALNTSRLPLITLLLTVWQRGPFSPLNRA